MDLMLTMPGRPPNESSRSTFACPARKPERDSIALRLSKMKLLTYLEENI